MESANDPRNDALATALRAASLRIAGSLSSRQERSIEPPELQREIEQILVTELSPLESQLRIAHGSAQVAHELRNPLAVISTSAEIISTKTTDPVILKHTTRIVRQAQAASSLALELLSAATAMLSIQLRPFSLWDVVSESVEQVCQRLPLVVRVAKNSDTQMVLIDDRRTQQILANLLTNAVQARPSGASIALSVSQTTTHVELHLLDQSGGIREDQRATLFVDHPSENRGSGHGIGLPLSRRLALLQGGDLSLRESTAEGSHFVLSLPLVRAAT